MPFNLSRERHSVWEVLVMDPTTLRQTANNLARVGALLTEEAIASGRDLTGLPGDLQVLKAAADLSRGVARRQEARAAQADDTAPLCMGCQHREDAPGGIRCSLSLDAREASAKRHCAQYKAE